MPCYPTWWPSGTSPAARNIPPTTAVCRTTVRSLAVPQPLRQCHAQTRRTSSARLVAHRRGIEPGFHRLECCRLCRIRDFPQECKVSRSTNLSNTENPGVVCTRHSATATETYPAGVCCMPGHTCAGCFSGRATHQDLRPCSSTSHYCFSSGKPAGVPLYLH